MSDNIYIFESPQWIHNDQSYRKIGSSKNPYVRLKDARTFNLSAKMKCYYLINNYNCYKLDNIIKIQFDHNRSHLPNGGTEFYHNVSTDELEKLFTLLGITYARVDNVDDNNINTITPDDMMYDTVVRIESEKYNKENSLDFTNINILILPIGKRSFVHRNYLKSVVNGIADIDRNKFGITRLQTRYTCGEYSTARTTSGIVPKWVTSYS